MNGFEVPGNVIEGTLTQALKMGNAIKEALTNGTDPVLALESSVLARGTLIDIDQLVKDGFLQGSVTPLSGQRTIKLFYHNEYLLASEDGKTLACTPDLLVLMEENSGTPLASESLRYGLQVALITLPSPTIWQTPEGLALVGPQAFGVLI